MWFLLKMDKHHIHEELPHWITRKGSSNSTDLTLTGNSVLYRDSVRVSFKRGLSDGLWPCAILKPNVTMCLVASTHHLLASWRRICAASCALTPAVVVPSCWKCRRWRGQQKVPCWRLPGHVARRRIEAHVGAAMRSSSTFNRRLLGLIIGGLPDADRCRSGFFRCWRPLWDFLLSLETPPSPPNRPRDSAMLIMYLAFNLTISCTVENMTFQKWCAGWEIKSFVWHVLHNLRH
jgi:hypothetical protein